VKIEIQELTKSYGGREVLRHATLTVPSGRLTALLGPSGSGKSTLLRLIAGLERPDGGDVLFDGINVTATPARHRGIGFCFQDYAPFRHMSVFDNVAYGLRVRKVPETVVATDVTRLLVRMGLAGHANHRPHELSGGQRQRMSLARALAIQPSVLLLDEPFAALDARVRSDIRGFVRNLQHELGITTILVTHDQSEAMEVADTIAVLDDGVVQQVGGPQQIYDQPANEFVKSFLGPTTSFRGSTVRPHQLTVRRDGSGERGVITDIVSLGFEVRCYVAMADGSTLWVQITHHEAVTAHYTVGESVTVALRTQVIDGGVVENQRLV
jgi:sulfate transport system ATP-binding protein